jgi:hypothetical protein
VQLVFVLDGASGAGSETHTATPAASDEESPSKADKAPEKSKGADDAE